MVGGYVILTKKPLMPGDNDVGTMYGSIENANKKVDILTVIQKPVLVECNVPVGGVTTKFAAWFYVLGASSTTVTLSSTFATLIYHRDTGIATLTVKEE